MSTEHETNDELKEQLPMWQAAKFLGVSKNDFYKKFVLTGSIPIVYVNQRHKRFKFLKDDLIQFIQTHRRVIDPDKYKQSMKASRRRIK